MASLEPVRSLPISAGVVVGDVDLQVPDHFAKLLKVEHLVKDSVDFILVSWLSQSDFWHAVFEQYKFRLSILPAAIQKEEKFECENGASW